MQSEGHEGYRLNFKHMVKFISHDVCSTDERDSILRSERGEGGGRKMELKHNCFA